MILTARTARRAPGAINRLEKAVRFPASRRLPGAASQDSTQVAHHVRQPRLRLVDFDAARLQLRTLVAPMGLVQVRAIATFHNGEDHGIA